MGVIMRQDIKEFFLIISMAVIAMLILIVSITLPVAYFDGRAKSTYLKEYRGIEMPWYQSTFMSVEINDAKVMIKK